MVASEKSEEGNVHGLIF